MTNNFLTKRKWSDARIAALKSLWADKLSAMQIAAELNFIDKDCGPVSRNAVLGKIHRLGLSDRRRSPRAPRAPRASRPPRARLLRVANHGNRLDVVDVLAPEPLPVDMTPAEVIPIGQRCTLMELTSATCCWPIGDPAAEDFFFCGGTPHGKLPYCACHARMAYQPVTARAQRAQAHW